MLLEQERLKLETAGKEQYVKDLQEKVENGKSAERLSINMDWKKFSDDLKNAIAYTKDNKNSYYDVLLDEAVTQDEVFKAVDKIRRWNYTTRSIEYLVGLIDERTKDGVAAQKTLDELKKQEEMPSDATR